MSQPHLPYMPAERKLDPLEDVLLKTLGEDLGLSAAVVSYVKVSGISRNMTARIRLWLSREGEEGRGFQL